uniref:Glutamate rich 1 n=1 Tax=Salvator merianae TaxID=96440 RepID=A0A8D0BKJ3_SALMN
MAASRRTEVFRKKVLEKLFPAPCPPLPIDPPDASSNIETSLVLEHPVLGQEDPEILRDLQGNSGKLKVDSLPGKMYTVSPAPEDYEPATYVETGHENTETDGANSDANTSGENDQEQPKRKRIRRKKQKNIWRNPDNVREGQAEGGKQEKLMEDNFQLQHGDGSKISRNKKRKMKKKRQKEKMRAAGLLTKPAGIDFTYKPEREGGPDFEDVDEKVDDILDFLQATQEIYFSESRASIRAESAVHSETVQEILQSLESRNMSSSDVALLHRMKSLVHLQNVGQLKDVLEDFHTQSVMPSDHAKAISALFLYWITDILPRENRK